MNFQYKNKSLFKGIIGGVTLGLIALVVPFLNSSFSNLSADLFPLAENQADVNDTDFYIPFYSSEAGEIGEIEIKAGKDIDTLLGFVFEISFPQNITVEGVSQDSTILSGKNFLVQENLAVPGKVTVVGATGGEGVSLQKDDVLLRLSFQISSDIPSDIQSELTFSKFDIIGTDMSEKAASVQNGAIDIQAIFNTFNIESFTSSENGTMEIVFDALIDPDFELADIQFFPEAITEYSFVEIEGEKLKLSRLNLVGAEKYTLSFPNINFGKNEEEIHDNFKSLDFFAPKDASPIFSIINTNIISDTELELFFSEPVNPETVEINDFLSRSLAFKSFEISDDKKKITLTLFEPQLPIPDNLDAPLKPTVTPFPTDTPTPTPTVSPAPISFLEDPDPLQIKYMESESGKPLKGNLSDVFWYPGIGPEMTNVQRIDHSTIKVEFLNPLNEETVDWSDFEIFAFTSVLECPAYPNIIDENTKMQISEDGKNITFVDLVLDPHEEYMVMILENSQEDREKNTVDFHQLKHAKNISTKNYNADFQLVSVIPTAHDMVEIEFSEVPSEESIKSIYIDIKHEGKKLTILNATQDEKNKKIVQVQTETMKEETLYILSLDPKLWKNETKEYLGGKNMEFFLSLSKENEFIIQNIAPYRAVENITKTLTLTGQNFPETFQVFANNTLLPLVSVSADKTIATVELPENMPVGQYTLKVVWTEYGKEQQKEYPDAFLIEGVQENEIMVISDKNYSSPKKVPNDGTTPAKLFVYVDDSRGLADIEKVTADLRIVGGDAGVELGKGQIENGMQIYVLENVIVPPTINTSTSAYKIPIVAQNKSGLHDEGFVQLWVSQDTTGSIPPTINNVTITPSTIIPSDTKNPVLISVQVSDEDGGEDITTVAVDLSSIGLNTIFLVSRNQGQITSKTRFFENQETIVIPDHITNGSYDVTITVIDAQGEEAKAIHTVSINRDASGQKPTMSSGDSYTTPTSDLVKDGTTPFQIHTKVTDPSGADTITSVSANLSQLGLPPVRLNPGVIEGRSQWFSSGNLTVPKSVNPGKRTIILTATDNEGNTQRQDISVMVGGKADIGRPPVVMSDENYTTPAVAVADGKTPFSAYILVDDLDDDISHVILKLGNTAVFDGESLPKGTSATNSVGEELCVSTRTLLCMQPILTESTGQWYYLSDLVIPKTITPRSVPYELDILAVDQSGKTSEGILQVQVVSADNVLLPSSNTLNFVQAIEKNKIQLVFSEGVDAKTVMQDMFRVTSALDKTAALGITNMAISPDGKIVTLTTEDQIPKGKYSLTMDDIALGLIKETNTENIVPFTGFETPENAGRFKLANISAVTPTQVSLSFSHPLKAQSVLDPKSIEIFIEGKKTQLAVESLTLSDANTVLVTTAQQGTGVPYDLYYKNIYSLYGEEVTRKTATKFRGYLPPLGEMIGNLHGSADLNQDGKVDFSDFTLFAAVYGKTYDQASNGDLNEDNVIDFKDFTLFSSQYGDVLNPNGNQNPDNTNSNSSNNSSSGSSSNDENLHSSGGSQDNTANNNSNNSNNSGSGTNTPFPTPLVYSNTPKPTVTPLVYSATPTPSVSATSNLAPITPTPSNTPLSGGGSGGSNNSGGGSSSGSIFSESPTPSATPASSGGSTLTTTPSASPSLTPTPSSSVSNTPTSTPTSTISATPSSSSTATPSVTPTPTATPSSSPSPSSSSSVCDDDPLVCLLM